jgi:broad specificity phosphatase PhoE
MGGRIPDPAPSCGADGQMFGWGVAPGRLFLVRHGQTDWSRTGRHTGRTDVPLDDTGGREAEAIGALLARHPFSLVLTSPLERAAETCRLAGYGDRAERCPDLVEWDYGEYEGRTTGEIREERPGWTLWVDGVPGGEGAADVGRRGDRVVARARAAEGDTLCFAHGHFLRVLASRWVGLPPAAGRLLALDAGSISVLGWERETPVVDRWNEAPLLPG